MKLFLEHTQYTKIRNFALFISLIFHSTFIILAALTIPQRALIPERIIEVSIEKIFIPNTEEEVPQSKTDGGSAAPIPRGVLTTNKPSQQSIGGALTPKIQDIPPPKMDYIQKKIEYKRYAVEQPKPEAENKPHIVVTEQKLQRKSDNQPPLARFVTAKILAGMQGVKESQTMEETPGIQTSHNTTEGISKQTLPPTITPTPQPQQNTNKAQEYKKYEQKIAAKFARYKYLLNNQHSSLQEVQIFIRIDHQGNIVTYHFGEDTNEELKAALTHMVHAANPVPPIPLGYTTEDTILFMIPIRLNGG